MAAAFSSASLCTSRQPIHSGGGAAPRCPVRRRAMAMAMGAGACGFGGVGGGGGVLGRRRGQFSSASVGKAQVARFSSNDSGSRVVGSSVEGEQRPSFSLDLAVLLAGFAFESYNTPAKDEGVREVDGRDCETVYLAKSYVEAIYDGLLFVKLKRGSQFPGLDLWGTSDPYVVFRLGDCCVRSRTIWANKDPVWNEDLKLNAKNPSEQSLNVAAWDANIVSAHRRLGNTAVSLENVCDGKRHDLELQLEGMGGGGRIDLEVQYKTFAEIDAEKNQSFLRRIFRVDILENAFKSVVGGSEITVGDFMGYFRSSQSQETDQLQDKTTQNAVSPETSAEEDIPRSQANRDGVPGLGLMMEDGQETAFRKVDGSKDPRKQSDNQNDEEVAYWKRMADALSQTLKPLGLDVDLSNMMSDKAAQIVIENVKRFGLESQKKAEAAYTEIGLTLDASDSFDPGKASDKEEVGDSDAVKALDGLLFNKQAVESLIKQTESILGVWAMFNKSLGRQQGDNADDREPEDSSGTGTNFSEYDDDAEIQGITDEARAAMFNTAESAMEAWALLATTMGGTSLVKSDFEKICFVENEKTDTQVAIWRDLRRRRLVIAFRGTEQTKWKDVITDLSLLSAGFNPERVVDGASYKDEILVHSGFLNAYDSVKSRLLTLVRASIDTSKIATEHETDTRWHVYVTGHSLGGALSTLFALELASSKLAKDRQLKVTMYNYGSPRVGNKLFAEQYNKVVKDSWRVVNHRDIVPTVPRLMGYCHVAQPIYLTAERSMIRSELLDDGYHGDDIGEATPDIILEKFMKGDQKILERLLDTEITMLRAMRDGSAVMQHMEDFYYITLLQRVEARVSWRRNA